VDPVALTSPRHVKPYPVNVSIADLTLAIQGLDGIAVRLLLFEDGLIQGLQMAQCMMCALVAVPEEPRDWMIEREDARVVEDDRLPIIDERDRNIGQFTIDNRRNGSPAAVAAGLEGDLSARLAGTQYQKEETREQTPSHDFPRPSDAAPDYTKYTGPVTPFIKPLRDGVHLRKLKAGSLACRPAPPDFAEASTALAEAGRFEL
jgi:hypothetical protein